MEVGRAIGTQHIDAENGLGSIVGIASGVAGATRGNSHLVLIAGLVGMIGT